MTTEPVTDRGSWFRVENGSTGSAVRRAAERLGDQLGLPTGRIADLAIVAAELTSNLIKHAEDGVLLLRPVRRESDAGVEMIAIDNGPGMVDLTDSARDGHSTTGTLGIGLGAIVRQASWFDAYSRPDRGTVIVVRVFAAAETGIPWVGGLTRPLSGETVSGDGHAARIVGDRRQVLVSDGLGHGPLATAATDAALTAFRDAPAVSPAEVVGHLHRAMSHTRGAALAVAELDPTAGVLRYAGLGNISGSVATGDGRRRGLVSLPGIAGHQRPTIRQYEYPFEAGSLLVMHTDGVVDRWQLADYPGLTGRSPLVVAATLMRDAGIRRDDAGVLVARSWA
ncbi:Anti-sigma regulatory factor (Ser/Thr protein kinase) [Micromonospora phaseoli]|uniref:Anti-sigma regulatory factor (Ser/Thr protein kinase) n=1 Tax=Micromonospora phaseoli TaxID=1144548 RepID=A0A1H7ASI3_9ACTN|nr:SpoIIE family protein phosphatase [Micromonospora phaseoli]PZV96199.1 anti-sigma regulatory factor (Ser/Thr protein kinase) [Micromonospora phaseoli]GIJ79475.1 transcriptional regulator [Micromonospora phaseoli]SEJ68559.1 Anti-sigma regulatory factor (Ser/Thr protein kinase) [Micromonospora phaseoli]